MMKGKAKDLNIRSISKGPIAVMILVLLFVTIGAGIVSTRKTILVNINGKERKIKTYKNNVKSILENNDIKIGKKDKISPALDAEVKDGDKIKIKRAVDVLVKVDGKELEIKSAEKNIEDMINAEGIKLEPLDKVIPSKSEPLKKGLVITIIRVNTKLLKEKKELNYTTEIRKNDNLEKGEKRIVQQGEKGEKLITTKVIYEDNKEVSRKVVGETIIKQPKPQIVEVGNKNVVRPSRGGESFAYSQKMTVKATAYTADEASTGKAVGDPYQGITATGTRARRNSGAYSTIAVDPRVIPLGTKVYVEGYGFAIAEDVGGAIKGNRIDVFLNSNSEANNWGVRWVNLYILK